MGTLTGTYIMTRLQDTLQDTDNTRWPREELLRYINDAQRAVVTIRPDANARTIPFQLALNTLQQMPADAARLIDVVRNLGADGTTVGRAVRLVARDTLDAENPDWHQVSSTVVVHYLYDVRNSRTFYVYPRPSAARYIELVYSATPTDLPDEASPIALDDLYVNSIIAYVLMRAYQKDEDYARNLDAANTWATMFRDSLGMRTEADSSINPNTGLGQ